MTCETSKFFLELLATNEIGFKMLFFHFIVSWVIIRGFKIHL